MRLFKIIVFGYLAAGAISLLSQLYAQATAGDALAKSLFELAGRLFRTPEVYPLIALTLLGAWISRKK